MAAILLQQPALALAPVQAAERQSSAATCAPRRAMQQHPRPLRSRPVIVVVVVPPVALAGWRPTPEAVWRGAALAAAPGVPAAAAAAAEPPLVAGRAAPPIPAHCSGTLLFCLAACGEGQGGVRAAQRQWAGRERGSRGWAGPAALLTDQGGWPSFGMVREGAWAPPPATDGHCSLGGWPATRSAITTNLRVGWTAAGGGRGP